MANQSREVNERSMLDSSRDSVEGFHSPWLPVIQLDWHGFQVANVFWFQAQKGFPPRFEIERELQSAFACRNRKLFQLEFWTKTEVQSILELIKLKWMIYGYVT